jgi:thioredoxin reductase
VEEFARYGRWFQHRALPDLDQRFVTGVARTGSGFRLDLEDGDRLGADGVVLATGMGAFPNIPAPFASLSPELVSHTSACRNRDLGRFAGRHVIVVGGGQSAIESAALLTEAGARAEVLLRQPRPRFLKTRPVLQWLMDCPFHPFRTPAKIGPLGINWLVEQPSLFTLFPRGAQDWMARRAIRPAASSWLRPRVEKVPIQPGRTVIAAEEHGARVRLRLSDGTDREADHVLLGTGYKIALARCRFLSPALLQEIRAVNGYPVLNRGFESSVPGLFFVGATAAYSFGPLCRFVAGTRVTAVALTNFVRRNVARRLVAVVRD